MNDIRVQIVNYKTKAWLLPCLKSVFADLKGSKIRYEVAILDNASGDDLSGIQKKFSGQPILNPDTKVVEPHTIRRLLRRATELGSVVVGPRLVTAQKRTQRWDHGESHGFKAWVALNTGHAYWREQREVTDVAWISGAVFLVENKWFTRLMGFDENFFLYEEELDFCLRLRAQGGKVTYDPTITVLHHGSVVAKKSKYLQESLDYFLRKHFPRFGHFLFSLTKHLFTVEDK